MAQASDSTNAVQQPLPGSAQEPLFLVSPGVLPPQIHLKVDTTLTSQKFSVSAYQSRMLALGEKVLATEFVEVPCEVLFSDVERAGGAHYAMAACGDDGSTFGSMHAIPRLQACKQACVASARGQAPGADTGTPSRAVAKALHSNSRSCCYHSSSTGKPPPPSHLQ